MPFLSNDQSETVIASGQAIRYSKTHPFVRGTSIVEDIFRLSLSDVQSARRAKSVSVSTNRGDFRDSNSRTSSNFFFTSSLMFV